VIRALSAAAIMTLLLAAAPAGAHVARPSDGRGEYGYSRAEAPPLRRGSVVVHYVRTGRDAPPSLDRDGDGVPDYVSCISTAANHALAYFRTAGFRPPRPDAGGGDPRPDIYVLDLDSPYAGLVLPPSIAHGGAFAMITSRPGRSSDRATCPRRTVAHESFHLVEAAYGFGLRTSATVVEGTAVAMGAAVYPHARDPTQQQPIAEYLSAPWRPPSQSPYGCIGCYRTAPWWQFLARDPALLPRYFNALAARPWSRRHPLPLLARALRPESLETAYRDFIVQLYRRQRLRHEHLRLRTNAWRTVAVRPLSAETAAYSQSGSARITVEVRPPRPRAALVVLDRRRRVRTVVDVTAMRTELRLDRGDRLVVVVAGAATTARTRIRVGDAP
jgi:hypothetical protein